MRIIQFIILVLCIEAVPLKAQELGYINDPDGYVNIRLKPSGQSKIIGIIITGQDFKYYPVSNTDWWKIEFKFQTGYIHKSRIKDFSKIKSEISKFFQNFYSTDRNNVELGEGNNEKLFLFTQDYPLATLKAFCEQKKEIQDFLTSEYESPISDLIDLQLIYSRLITLITTCSEISKITHSLEIAANNTGLELKNTKTFIDNIPNSNRPDKHTYLLNKWFVSELNGKAITYYLNNPKIDTYAKMFYQGQFAVSDDLFTFTFLDSILTSNPENRVFYLYIFNSVLRLTDGALSEYIGIDCRAYLEKYPCDFIKIKDSKLYSDNYENWIDFAAFEYYSEQNPILSINNNTELLKQKVQSNCPNQVKELENIRIKLIEFVKENE